MLDLESLPRFPCGHDKRPLTAHGFQDASYEDFASWPLIGVPTGGVFDVLDVDPKGMPWLREVEPDLPPTRQHITPRGRHLLFRSAGLRSRAGIWPGVDVRARGGYVIWWPRQGYEVVRPEALAPWPEWLLAKFKERRSPKAKSHLTEPHCCVSRVIGVGLWSFDVLAYRDQARWFGLMCLAKAAGVSREDWITWSISDPLFAGDAEVIGRRWDSLNTEPSPDWQPTRKLRTRITGLQQMVASDPWGEPTLFKAACMLAEIVMREGILLKEIGVGLLLDEWGGDQCEAEATIDRAFERVATKLILQGISPKPAKGIGQKSAVPLGDL